VNANNQGSASANSGNAGIDNPISSAVDAAFLQAGFNPQTNLFDPFLQFGNQQGTDVVNPGPHDIP
jgi:hypothetical protein